MGSRRRSTVVSALLLAPLPIVAKRQPDGEVDHRELHGKADDDRKDLDDTHTEHGHAPEPSEIRVFRFAPGLSIGSLAGRCHALGGSAKKSRNVPATRGGSPPRFRLPEPPWLSLGNSTRSACGKTRSKTSRAVFR